MKKFKSIICTLLAVVAMSLLITGCGASIEKQIIGTWTDPDASSKSLVFYEDGTCETPWELFSSATYTIESDNTLKISSTFGGIEAFSYVDYEDMEDSDLDNIWCINEDKIYINSTDNYFVKQ